MENKVKVVRISEGMQQKDLALKVGISRQTLSLIEKGQYNPSLKLCIKLAEALESDLNSLFWRI
ncbi:helix-turn-helix transcriptional regulator [Holzapfeliella sp. JNUCC 72]